MIARAFRGITALTALLTAVASPAAHAEPAPKTDSRARAERLATLRTEVSELDAAIRSRRSQRATALRGLAARVTELELGEDAERVKVRALEAEVEALRAKDDAHRTHGARLREGVREAIAAVEATVRAGLPFKTEERLAALALLSKELEAAKTDPEDVAVRLWRFIEDEQRLTETVEQVELPLALDGAEAPTLVRVIRVGTLALFVHRPDGRWSRIARDGAGAFTHDPIADPARVEELERLLAATRQRVIGGRFRLPLLGEGACPK